ncbi:MAG: type II toxin-antitoxin system VapC family toxin [Myxococcota bacterium]
MSAERIVIDTNAWSDLMRGAPAVTRIVRAAHRVLMSAIVVGELEYGFRRGAWMETNLERLDRFLANPHVRFLFVTRTTSDRFGRILSALRAKGTPIPTNDVWIAAHALETGGTLVTRDKHFEQVDGLPLIEIPTP